MTSKYWYMWLQIIDPVNNDKFWSWHFCEIIKFTTNHFLHTKINLFLLLDQSCKKITSSIYYLFLPSSKNFIFFTWTFLNDMKDFSLKKRRKFKKVFGFMLQKKIYKVLKNIEWIYVCMYMADKLLSHICYEYYVNLYLYNVYT